MVEDLGLSRLSRRDEVLVQDVKDIFANRCELSLDLLAVLLDQTGLGVVPLGLLLLLDGGDDSPRSSTGANDVLVRDRKQISLLDGKLLVGRGNVLHVLHHFYSSGPVSNATGEKESGKKEWKVMPS